MGSEVPPTRTLLPPLAHRALLRLRQMVTAMRDAQIKPFTQRHHPCWIDHVVTVIVMLFDVPEIHRARYTRPLIQLAGITSQIRVILNAANVAFEMAMIDRVKPYQCGEQPPVRFGELASGQITALRQMLLQPVERLEQRHAGLFVS